MRWNQHVRQIQKEAYVFYLVFKHPRTRWYAKLVAACSAGYLFSPVQLIPSFIPVVGLMDDVLVLYLGAKLLYRITPPDVLKECRERCGDRHDTEERKNQIEGCFSRDRGAMAARSRCQRSDDGLRSSLTRLP